MLDTLGIRKTYAKGTLLIRYEYAIHTFVKACGREVGLKVVRIIRFPEICIRFLKFAYAIHTLYCCCTFMLRITTKMYSFGNLFALLRINSNTYHLKSLNLVGCTTKRTF